MESGNEREIGGLDIRFYTQHITHPPRLIAVLLICLPDRIHVVDPNNPLILRELDVAAEIVQVLDERAEDLAVSWFRLGGHETDDVGREVGVVFVVVEARLGS